MKALSDFYSRILPKVPGCPDPLLRDALVDSAIEFCEQTLIVQVTSDPQDVTKGNGLYELDLPTGQKACATMKVWYGTSELVAAPSEQVDLILAYISSVGGKTPDEGTPKYFYEMSPGVIGIYPVPDTTRTSYLSARVATKPSRTATSLDDILYEDWIEAVCGGTVSRLMSIPAQAFTNDPAQYEYRFRQGIGRATNIRIRGRINGSLSVQQRPLV